MAVDFFLIFSMAVCMVKFAHAGVLSVDAAGIFLVIGALGIIFLRLLGSTAFREYARPKATLISFLFLGLSFMDGDTSAALEIMCAVFLGLVAVSLAPFGLYVATYKMFPDGGNSLESKAFTVVFGLMFVGIVYFAIEQIVVNWRELFPILRRIGM